MPDCPVCFGAGCFDDRDVQALMGEYYTDAELREFGSTGFEEPRECEECEGTGIVSVEREKDLVAQARAYMDQVIAIHDAAGRPAAPRDRLSELLERLEA